MRAVGAVFGLVLVVFGVALIVKAAGGGSPEATVTAIVLGVLCVLAGLALAASALRAFRARRR